MTIEFKRSVAVLSDIVSVEEAETLLEWLHKKSGAKVDLGDCVHLHPANLQVLMATRPVIHVWPTDVALRGWLESALIAH